jgi:2-hydroxychromene-2-carboxylate isomerase
VKTVHWYFDYISPFAYLQSHRLEDFTEYALVRCKPVLFGALLAHHGHKGPAEIAAKRGWTYEHALWLAQRNNVPMRLPAAHPFNPLPLLRLSVLLGSPIHVVRRLFAYVWVEGHLPQDAPAWSALLDEFGVTPADLDAPEVKDGLRRNTEEAIAAGVFGVPTSIVDGHLIWGFDATDMVHAKIADDPFFESPEVAAAHALPVGVQRRTG